MDINERSIKKEQSLRKPFENEIKLATGESVHERRAENFKNQATAFNQIIDKERLSIKVIKNGDTNIRVIHRKDDKDLGLKISYLVNAINRLKKNGVDFPSDIKIKMCPEIDESYAFNGSKDGMNYPHIYLGKNIFEYNPANKELSSERAEVVGGVGYGMPRILADQIYDKALLGMKKSKRAEACIVHELGHIIHEGTNPKKFYEYGDIGVGKLKGEKADEIAFKIFNTGSKVSDYAGRTPCEYVAEVFTGLNFGKKYDKDVLDLYLELGGPQVKKRLKE